jgi:hypothetical protein
MKERTLFEKPLKLMSFIQGSQKYKSKMTFEMNCDLFLFK